MTEFNGRVAPNKSAQRAWTAEEWKTSLGDCCDIWVGKWIGENSIGDQIHRIEQKEG